MNSVGTRSHLELQPGFARRVNEMFLDGINTSLGVFGVGCPCEASDGQ